MSLLVLDILYTQYWWQVNLDGAGCDSCDSYTIVLWELFSLGVYIVVLTIPSYCICENLKISQFCIYGKHVNSSD